jgi:hypothetical protein
MYIQIEGLHSPKHFYRQSKSKTGSPQWQCKECKKKTAIRPNTNFCLPVKTGKVNKTPAQRLGITDKVFELQDILYLR